MHALIGDTIFLRERGDRSGNVVAFTVRSERIEVKDGEYCNRVKRF
jgi:hypothetical protein